MQSFFYTLCSPGAWKSFIVLFDPRSLDLPELWYAVQIIHPGMRHAIPLHPLFAAESLSGWEPSF